MDFVTVKRFLGYLCSRLEDPWDLDLDDNEGTNSHLSNLFKWICTIFDAHYPQFVYHNETGIVESLLAIMDQKMKLMRDIEDLEPLLISAIGKVSFQPSQSSSKYRSETVLFE